MQINILLMKLKTGSGSEKLLFLSLCIYIFFFPTRLSPHFSQMHTNVLFLKVLMTSWAELLLLHKVYKYKKP